MNAKRALRRMDDVLLGGFFRHFYHRHLKFAGSGLPRLGADLVFPDPRGADPRGIVALGGDLSPERLLAARRSGIFPYFMEGEPILWWSPDPRCALEPAKIHVSRRLREHLRKGTFTATFDRAFDAVVAACRDLRAEDTWITGEVVASYRALHARGDAHSVEVWIGEELAGGLFGISIGGFFAVDSMFSMADNASKVAMVALAAKLSEHGYLVIDCGFPKEHFLRLGARPLPRDDYLELVRRAVEVPSAADAWAALAAVSVATREVAP